MPTVTVNQAAATLFGGGNSGVSKETIKTFINQPGRTAEEVLDAAVKHNVNKEQIAEAMAGDERFTKENIDRYLKDQGITEPPKPVHAQSEIHKPKVALNALFGAGNKKVSDGLIREYITTEGRSAKAVVEAALQYDVSVDQIVHAMAGHEAFTPERINSYLASAGLDKASLIQAEVAHWSQADFDRVVAGLGAQGQGLAGLEQALIDSYGGIAPLMAEARVAQDHAAQLKGEYDAIALQADRGMADYTLWVEELHAAEALKQQAQADLEAGQQALSGLDAIEEKRDQRATAQANAQYQIEAAQQRLAQAQQRIDAANSKMEALQAWGQPLLDQQAAARSAWEQAEATAQQKSELVNARLTQTADVVEQKNEALSELTLTHDKLVAFLVTHPNLESAEQVRASIQDSIGALAQTLASHRAWTDSLIAQGVTLNEEATALETQAAELAQTLNLDEVLLERGRAESRLNEAQQAFDTAKAALERAQQDIDGAYQARMDANQLSGKRARARGRDEADRRKALAAEVLEQAQQRFNAAQADLEQVRAETLPVIEQALKVEAQGAPLNVQAANARAQVDEQINLAMLANRLEGTVQSSMAAANMQLIGLGKTKVLAAQALVESGQIDTAQLAAIEKSVRLDLEDAIGALQYYEQTASGDRQAEGQARAQFAALQGISSGNDLIAENLLFDAEGFGQALADLNVAGLKEQVQQAADRLQAAKERDEMADMRMDWAERRTKPSKRTRDINRAAPEIEAAEKELEEAQRAYDELSAQLRAAQTMEAPMRRAAEQAAFEAMGALQNAQRSGAQTQAAAAWAGIAQARYQSSDTALAAAQMGVIEGTRALAQLQKTLATTVSDEQAAQVLGAQAAQTNDWAETFAGHVADVRQTEQQALADAMALDQLTVEATAKHIYSEFLTQRVDTLSQAYLDIKNNIIPELESQFGDALTQMNADAAIAEDLDGQMRRREAQAGLEFANQRNLTPVTPDAMLGQAYKILGDKIKEDPSLAVPGVVGGVDQAQAQALAAQLAEEANAQRAVQTEENPQPLFDEWLKKEMARIKKSTHKQLRLLDDLAQAQDNDAHVQALRKDALAAAQTAHHSALNAVDAGQSVQAFIVLAASQAQRALLAQNLAAETSASAAQLSAQAAQQANTLARSIDAQQGAQESLVQGLADYVSGTTSQAAQLRQVAASTGDQTLAKVLSDGADGLDQLGLVHSQFAQGVQSRADTLDEQRQAAESTEQTWATLAADWQQKAAQANDAATAFEQTVNAELEGLKARADSQAEALNPAFATAGMALSAIRAHEARAEYSKDIHEQRERMDRFYKKQKKNKLFRTIVNVGVNIAAALLAIETFGQSLSWAQALGTTAIFTGANAATQGINIAAGLQEKFSKDALLAAASSGVFFAMAAPVAQTVEKALEGTLFAVGRGGVPNVLAEVPQGSFGAIGKGLADAAGGVAGNLMQQGFDLLTGRSDQFSWDSLKFAAALWGTGGVISHFGGPLRSMQWPSVQGTNPLYLRYFFNQSKNMNWSFINHAQFFIRRTMGVVTQQALLKAMGLRNDVNFVDGFANGAAIAFAGFGLTRLMSDKLLTTVSGQFLPKLATLVTDAAIKHLVDGRTINWDSLISTSWGWGFGVTAGQMTRNYLDQGSDQLNPSPQMGWLLGQDRSSFYKPLESK